MPYGSSIGIKPSWRAFMSRSTSLALTLAAGLAALASSSANAGTVCPAAGVATAGPAGTTGCNLVITIAANNVATVGPGTAGGGGTYDGSDDTLIGVINNSSNPVSTIFLSSPVTANGGIFGFDGDGVDGFLSPPIGNNAKDPTGYGGPNGWFNNIAANGTSGNVNFITAIAANGGTAFFSLENPLVAANFNPPVVGGVPEPSTWAMMLLGFVGLGFAFRQSRRKTSFA
jgi:hypothetical protein